MTALPVVYFLFHSACSWPQKRHKCGRKSVHAISTLPRREAVDGYGAEEAAAH